MIMAEFVSPGFSFRLTKFFSAPSKSPIILSISPGSERTTAVLVDFSPKRTYGNLPGTRAIFPASV